MYRCCSVMPEVSSLQQLVTLSPAAPFPPSPSHAERGRSRRPPHAVSPFQWVASPRPPFSLQNEGGPAARPMRVMRTLLESIEDLYMLSNTDLIITQVGGRGGRTITLAHAYVTHLLLPHRARHTSAPWPYC